MTESDNSKHREDKAVQALITAALHVSDADVTEEEIRPYLGCEVVLSSEDEAALVNRGFPTNLTREQKHELTRRGIALIHHPLAGFGLKTETVPARGITVKRIARVEKVIMEKITPIETEQDTLKKNWIKAAMEESPERIVMKLTTTGGIKLSRRQKRYAEDAIRSAFADLLSRIE